MLQLFRKTSERNLHQENSLRTLTEQELISKVMGSALYVQYVQPLPLNPHLKIILFKAHSHWFYFKLKWST